MTPDLLEEGRKAPPPPIGVSPMSRVRIFVLALVWAVSLSIAWGLGYTRGNTVRISAEEAQRKAEVTYLMKIAYPREIPSLEVIQKVRALSERPEEVRAYLVEIESAFKDEADKQMIEAMTLHLPSAVKSWESLSRYRQEILGNLGRWKPGQTEPTAMEKPKP